MKKLVLKVEMPDDEAKRKAMKTVAGLSGIDLISIDMKHGKLTLIGTVDPTKVVSRLRRHWRTELLTVGPAKEEPKKDEAKSNEGAGDKKPEGEVQPKKEGGTEEAKEEEEDGKKEGTATEEAAAKAGTEMGGKKEKEEVEKKVDPVLEMVKAYRAYNPSMTKYYYVHSMEENPNACVIC